MSKSKLCFFVVCLTWLLLLLIVPFILPGNTVNFGEKGRVGTNDFQNQTEKMSPVAGFVYSTGDSFCHQKASRSFFLNGNQMPYCSRCTGIFLGLMIGACIAVFKFVDFKWQWIVIGLLPIGMDGIGQMFGFWESTNMLRLITGGLAGILTGLAVAVIIQELCASISKHTKTDVENKNQDDDEKL
ncbi:MAG: DUF2085 domain-containing protein [Candidatus Thermoplasmatota archaeon]|nr:DUF2085 domain-containing protein [Candidatus Thermoplasmatota archaeon]